VRELERLGDDGGGAIDALARRRALDSYLRFGRETSRFPRRWRHDYAALPFDDLYWSSGRIAVAASQRATGLVHAGSTYLTPPAAAAESAVVMASLADAVRRVPARVAEVRGHIVPFDADRFTALANAFQNCGAYVELADGIVADEPIPIVWTAAPGAASAVFPYTIIRLGANARATIVERHLGAAESFVCGIVEADLGPGARLDYVVVQHADPGARILCRRAARCAGGAHVTWHLADLGGALARTVLEARLEGPLARADTNALFFATGFANVDLTVDVAQNAPETQSQTIVRSAATGRGHGRFAGTIAVTPRARRCRASMRDDALVLSRDGYLEAIPALEIGANDVSVAHAATVGSLDEEQLFYLQTRGIARGSAERMVALAFFEPAISRFPSDALREEVRISLEERLEEVPETFAS